MYDLISDTYRELNRELHTKGTYGKHGNRWASAVAALLTEGGHVSILDYGCGAGSLKETLGIEVMREYDPAVEGKDHLPLPAELVVCTDVLEHIEPEKLDNVLKHLQRLCRRQAFFVIATRPAMKHLSDGRNAHLIIESPEWWREKLQERFKIDRWEVHTSPDGKPGEIMIVASPRLEVGSIHGVSAVPDDLRYLQARENIKKVSSRIFGLSPKKPAGHIILCAYGPSLTKTWESIEQEKNVFLNSKVVSVSGAHDFLIERGIVPDYHIEVDPREHKAVFTKNSHPDVHYLMGSCCHPTTINQLVEAGRQISLFHIYNGPRDLDIINELEPDTELLAGGGSVGLRAINLLYALGYRSFSTRGLDSSYDDDIGQHAGEHSGKRHHEIDVEVGGRWFKSSLIMIAYARYFFAEYKKLSQVSALRGEEPLNEEGEYVNIIIHGDGMLAAMAREILEGNVEEEAA